MKDHLGFKIKKIAQEKEIKINVLAAKLGLTRAGIYEIFKRKEISTELLKKISIILKVPMSYWFNDDEKNRFDNMYYLGDDECGAKLAEANKIIESLQDKIKIQYDLISSKDKTISILENQKK